MKRRNFFSLWTSRLCLLCAPFLAGCTSFSHDWKKAGLQPSPVNDLQGRWQGRWASEANSHNGELRCVITLKDGRYLARFHATYGKMLTFGYTVPLQVRRTNDVFEFTGEANLHWWAGGVYHYDGHASATNFFATYRCQYDHGTFQMTRPEANSPTNAAASKTNP